MKLIQIQTTEPLTAMNIHGVEPCDTLTFEVDFEDGKPPAPQSQFLVSWVDKDTRKL